MPTGYTAIVIEKPDCTFADFAWTCVRAMGACVMQRDDSLSSAINITEQPSAYYQEQLRELRERRAKIADMSEREWEAFVASEREKGLSEFQKSRQRLRNENAAFAAMREQVVAWCPPSDLRSLQDFMLQQLEVSMSRDDSDEPDEWTARLYGFAPQTRAERLQKIAADIEHAKQSLDEELERVESRNRYKRMLLESVGEPSLIQLARNEG